MENILRNWKVTFAPILVPRDANVPSFHEAVKYSLDLLHQIEDYEDAHEISKEEFYSSDVEEITKDQFNKGN